MQGNITTLIAKKQYIFNAIGNIIAKSQFFY
nr:MAG TPA: hypothetical protein [Caudoviricetes sp.]